MYQRILNDLYSRYYQHYQEHPEITSSFWREFGYRHRVAYQNGKWDFNGFGLGHFVSKTWRNTIRQLPATVLSQWLLKKYQCPSRLSKAGLDTANLSHRIFNFDCAKQVLAVNKIGRQLSIDLDNASPFSKCSIKTVCVVGDGYSFCSNLLKRIDPDLKVILVNLGRSLFFDVLFCEKCVPEEKTVLIQDRTMADELIESHSLIFVEAEKYHHLKGFPIDLFINITSMQEMNPGIVSNYFQYMRESSSDTVYLYCCNRLEKTLPDGTRVRFMDYPWNDCQILLDELCPWHQKYPESGIPVWREFDGPIQHRFVRLK